MNTKFTIKTIKVNNELHPVAKISATIGIPYEFNDLIKMIELFRDAFHIEKFGKITSDSQEAVRKSHRPELIPTEFLE